MAHGEITVTEQERGVQGSSRWRPPELSRRLAPTLVDVLRERLGRLQVDRDRRTGIKPVPMHPCEAIAPRPARHVCKALEVFEGPGVAAVEIARSPGLLIIEFAS